MVVLNGAVPLVIMQFRVSNPAAIPATMKCLNCETQEERVERKFHSNGTVFIKPSERCSLAEFPWELEESGYELVDGFCQQRADGRDFSSKRTYHAVRFVFLRNESVEISSGFDKKMLDIVRAELRGICTSALWRVRAYSNPFYKNGLEIPGECAVRINFEVREPYLRPNGHPVTAWQKDENGKRLGEISLPIKAEYSLRIVDNTVSLVKV